MTKRAEELAAEVKGLVLQNMFVNLAAYFERYGYEVREAAAKACDVYALDLLRADSDGDYVTGLCAEDIRKMPLS